MLDDLLGGTVAVDVVRFDVGWLNGWQFADSLNKQITYHADEDGFGPDIAVDKWGHFLLVDFGRGLARLVNVAQGRVDVVDFIYYFRLVKKRFLMLFICTHEVLRLSSFLFP